MKHHQFRRLLTCLILLLCVRPVLADGDPFAESATPERERLRHRLESAAGPDELSAGDQPIHCGTTLRRFYLARLYEPAWATDQGVSSLADSLVAALRCADREGLQPTDYHLAAVMELLTGLRETPFLEQAHDPRPLVDLELLLTDAFLLYGSHCLSGRVDPETIDSEWFANRRQADLAQVLQEALVRNDVGGALRGLLPPQPAYGRLRQALKFYRDLADAGGWATIPTGPKLESGVRDVRIPTLRTRLQATGDLAGGAQPADADSLLFDASLAEAVLHYQQRHGLEADGVVGKSTLASMNVTAEQRSRQIAVNLERWRWLPQDLGRKHLLVNIANFRLDVMENGLSVLDMAVIVGRTYRRTPVFSADMTYLVFSPAWEVPAKLARLDILPQIQEDPAYLTRKGFRVLQGWGAAEQEIDPETVDWQRLSASDFPYRLRQRPGPENALGGVKFMFPNKFSIYMHDTSSPKLFAETVRTFSSGCIRIGRPVELARYILSDDAKWTEETIRPAMGAGVEKTVRVPSPLPVHLLYWTAWVDEDGTVRFLPDIYDRDQRVDAALLQPPPSLAGERGGH